MSILQDIDNIKIPYPTEGVIRTAQLDDTVAPSDSVQLAVNMNFDRVGAIQSRLGITQYADDLDHPVRNYGTLVNDVQQSGYVAMSILGTVNDMTFNGNWISFTKLNDTTVFVFYTNASTSKGAMRIATIDASDGSFSVGSEVIFDDMSGDHNCSILLNETSGYVVDIWNGVIDSEYVACTRTFYDSGGTPTARGSVFQLQAAALSYPSACRIDDTHFIVFYEDSSHQATAQVIEDDGSGTLSSKSTLVVDSSSTSYESLVQIDANHFVAQWWNGTNVVAQVLEVNLSTWAASKIGSSVDVNSSDSVSVLAPQDATHVVSFSQVTGAGGITTQTLAIDGSYAIILAGTPLTVSESTAATWLNAVKLDDTHSFLTVQQNGDDLSFVQLFERDVTSQDITSTVQPISGLTMSYQNPPSTIALDAHTTLYGSRIEPTSDMYEAMFTMVGPYVEGKYLYAQSGSEVFNTESQDSGAWTSRRSGLSTASKARFAQYLNYIWMVNGNDIKGGDPIATSNGGDFGTDLVPVGFPGGDFISAGFEGRVWVANATRGVIYYTDIVQFTPPSTYTLTYNQSVNFITTLTPQTGQTITALQVVPRALLVFTEDSIFRVYGASSIDAYPAYNVGTFSQESIVTTKTGIFFHHSSGFYQFDYGSQPVEISRRIIDFVKAIPRSEYENIVGVYDGFDNVEWAIGQVTVEGVVYSNCVVRYTISTQVWTIYDYPKNAITAMIYYDDGTSLNHLVATTNTAGESTEYKTGALDTGDADFGKPFYFEYIDRWRSFTDMYYLTKRIDAVNVYHKNAAGANLMYQCDHASANAWKPLGAVTADNVSILPNNNTDDFNVMRLRLAGNTKGEPIIIHGFEILQITIKGQKRN